MPFSFIPFSKSVCCRDSDGEDLVTLQERQKQLLAGKSPVPEEGSLESIGAKGDSSVPITAVAPLKKTAKEAKEGTK